MRATTRTATTWMVVLACTGPIAGCGGAPVDAGAPSTSAGAIADGARDFSDTNVVGIVRATDVGFNACSGSLLAPNLVLTAHHCVADIQHADDNLIDCTVSSFA